MGCASSKKDALNPECVDLSHFIVGSCIGKGGFGKVHAVLHRGSGVQMAMKRLTKNKIVSKGAWHLNAVWIERNLLELLQTPYTNRLYFAFQSPWELFLVTPYYRGGDLNWYLSTKGKMKNGDIAYYGAELLLGLAELRKLNIVYRDFKPENCLFNDEGHIALSDFGICGQLNEKNSYKLSDRFGTLTYMSPQQYKGKAYDYCCDYFAFGLVLFEMATGKQLHSAPNRDVEQESNDWYASKLGAIASPVLKSLIQSLLEVDRTKRIGVNDIEEIFQHKFFASINFDEFRQCEYKQKPPHVPDVKKMNCSLENLAMDAISDEDPEDEKPPTEQQQAAFVNFEFNHDVKDEWTNYWADIKTKPGKEQDAAIQSLWDKAVDTNAFEMPKDALTVNDMNSIELDIKASMKAQIQKSSANEN